MSDEIIEQAFARIRASCDNARDEYKFGVAQQALFKTLHDYVSNSRGGGLSDRIAVRETTNPETLQRLSTIQTIGEFIDWAKELTPHTQQALELSGDMLKLQNGECRFIMYPDFGQICFEGNQTINNVMLGRLVAAAIESGRHDLLPLAKTRGGVAILASAATTEHGNRPGNDHLHMQGRFNGSGQFNDLTQAQVDRFKETGVIDSQYLHATAIEGEHHSR